MTHDRYFFHGECEGLDSLQDLCTELLAKGIATEAHRCSIRLQGFECDSIEFDRPTEGEASIEGTAKDMHVAQSEAKRLSDALTSLNIKHWLEITDAKQNPIVYVHNQWPEVEG